MLMTKFDHEERYQKYRSYLNPDMPEAQAREFIETLWGVMNSFVDMAWSQDPVSLAKSAHEKEAKAGSRS